MKMKSWLSRRAGIKGSTIVWLLVLGAVAYPAYQWFVPQWRYWRILHALSGTVNERKLNTIETIRTDTLRIVADIGTPEGFEESLRITPNPNSPNGRHMVKVQAEWDDTVHFFGRFPKSFRRTLDREMSLQK